MPVWPIRHWHGRLRITCRWSSIFTSMKCELDACERALRKKRDHRHKTMVSESNVVPRREDELVTNYSLATLVPPGSLPALIRSPKVLPSVALLPFSFLPKASAIFAASFWFFPVSLPNAAP